MGCGKSKLDTVANGSILTRKKSSVNGGQEAVKEEQTIPANGINKEEESKSMKLGETVEGGKVTEEEKELAVVEGEGLVSKESPDEYFSSRHQREASLDNKSVYSSPRVDSKESPFDDHQEVNNVDVNGDDHNGAIVDDHPVDGTITTEATATITTTTT